MSAVGPLLPRIRAELGVPYAVVGLLGTIPVVCMGVFAPLTPWLSSRLGARRAVTACVLFMGAAGLARAASPGVVTLLVTTVALGIAMGVGGALLPVAVKHRLPHRPMLGSGVYAAGIQLGAAIGAFVAVPLALAFGGWRGSLALISGATVVLGVIWWALRRGDTEIRSNARRPALPLRNRLAWLVAITFGLLSANYHGVMAWLVAYLVETGWDEVAAGGALAVTSTGALVASVALPTVADRHGSRRTYLVSSSIALIIGLAGLVVMPAWGWVWASIVGLSQGTMFLTSLVLPLDVADGPASTGAVTGLVLGAGFLIAAPAPAVLGAARDATGSFVAPMVILVLLAVALLVISSVLSPRRLAAGVEVAQRG